MHRPALRFEEFFRRFQALKTERGVPMPPDGIKPAILLAMLLAQKRQIRDLEARVAELDDAV